MNSVIKYNKAVLKYEDKERCVEITVTTKKEGTVSLVYTVDEWKTSRSQAGMLVSKEKDLCCYRVSLPLTNATATMKIWFALKLIALNAFNNATEEFWDNNNSWNYEIFPDKLPKICLPSASSSSSSSSSSAASSLMKAQALAPLTSTYVSKNSNYNNIINNNNNNNNNSNNIIPKVEMPYAALRLPPSSPAPLPYSPSSVHLPHAPFIAPSHTFTYPSPSKSSYVAMAHPSRTVASLTTQHTKSKPKVYHLDSHAQLVIAPVNENYFCNDKNTPLIAFSSRNSISAFFRESQKSVAA